MKKLFFISDIHGFYTETIEALEKNGYDENNPNHLLIVLGDIFDRGHQSLDIYKWLSRLTEEKKAIVTNGNHHLFLINFLEHGNSYFNFSHNGLRETVESLSGLSFVEWCSKKEGTLYISDYQEWADMCANTINEKYPQLLGWLKDMPRYFESKNYIGVHAAIDTSVLDWHYPCCIRGNLVDWDALDFDDGSFLGKPNRTGKTIVAGHFDTGSLREIYHLGEQEDFSILKTDDNKVFIDGCTVYSGIVNIFITEDEV